jgi:transcriptional regulator with XRE-family HTH domain
METFGSVVRAARREQGLSLEALAERAGTTKAVLSGVEDGRRHADSVTTEKLVEVLGLDPEYTRLAFDERVAALGNITVAELRARIDLGNALHSEYNRLGLTRFAVFDTAHQPPRLVSEHDSPIDAQNAAALMPGAKTVGPDNGSIDAECVDYLLEEEHDEDY